MTETTYEYARKQIFNDDRQIDIELLKLKAKRIQNNIKMMELKNAFDNGENK